MQALAIHAGPRARAQLQAGGLRPQDVRVIPAAAGGPKGLILSALDQFIFGQWLPQSTQTVHLLGASIGAWRMATACTSHPEQGFRDLASDYIAQDYPHEPGKPPTAAQVSSIFGAKLHERFGARTHELLSHPRYRLHVFTSRGRHVLNAQGGRAASFNTALGYAGAFLSNAVHRRGLSAWLQRVVFSDPRDMLPLPLDDLHSQQVELNEHNLIASMLASCSIPFWLLPVQDIAGAPKGAYWDGGITDYHLHLGYAALHSGLVLYPHFQSTVVPGWLDKSLPWRHRASPKLDNVVLLSPRPEWLATLPGGKLPDRSDFKRFQDDVPGRMRAWRTAVAQSQQLADEFAQWLEGRMHIDVKPLR